MKIRLSKHQRVALKWLIKPGYALVWSSMPEIVDAEGKYRAEVRIQTAISFRWRDYIHKDDATGWYVITDIGSAALAEATPEQA
jgi:hypothetical protein